MQLQVIYKGCGYRYWGSEFNKHALMSIIYKTVYCVMGLPGGLGEEHAVGGELRKVGRSRRRGSCFVCSFEAPGICGYTHLRDPYPHVVIFYHPE